MYNDCTMKYLKRLITEINRYIKGANYAIPYEADHRRVVKAGVNFDSATHTIEEWVIEVEQ